MVPGVMGWVMGVRRWLGSGVGDELREAEAEAARAVRAARAAEEEVRRRSGLAWEAAREAGRAAERAARAVDRVGEVRRRVGEVRRRVGACYKEGGWP